MQEEVNQKTVALSIRTTKLTGKVLAAALGKVARALQKHHRKALTPQGRQSVKKLAQQGEFDYDAVYNIMNEEKKSELDTVTIKNETLRKYFPRNYTPRQMESIIIKPVSYTHLRQSRSSPSTKAGH